MFDQFLEGNQYYDYPSFEVALYSLLLALVLSSIMAFTYKFTYEGDHFSKNMFQAMILSSLVTSMIMMAVGNNLAVGFGIIGAVAIIRFRTNVQNPRNVIFIFAALSIGIATGVYGYAVAVAGTFIFCLTAIILNYSSYRVKALDSYSLECGIFEEATLETFQSKLNELCTELELQDIRQRIDRSNRYTFLFTLKEGLDIESVYEHMKMDGVEELKINRKRQLLEQL
ncbi:DUF4956 domain-containing protein [Marinoscillum sp. MHG1-6]|uniref:DUF4956 domain-containing protein n=1 Tax=Marinoscillum sp. MHG1-6 TaxID=2959627 RepID=UPI002158542D|nr:DUF4956 domain-containing protein [Marinoscillum sp. MHG1-6]